MRLTLTRSLQATLAVAIVTIAGATALSDEDFYGQSPPVYPSRKPNLTSVPSKPKSGEVEQPLADA
jgi:hypothetical protein